MELEQEVLRCRDRIHKLQTTVSALELLHTQLRKDFDPVKLEVAAMARADEIAVQVAKRLNDERRVRFTKWQQLAGLVSIAAVLADTASHFVS